MKLIFRLAMMPTTLVLLLLFAVGGRPDHTTAAARLAGTPDGAATLEVTPEATAEATEEPSVDEMTLLLTHAPSPDAGAIGLATEVDQEQVRIKAVVPDGPADKAGLLPGDVITAIDGKPITGSEALNAAIAPKKAGDTLTFTIEREGQEQELPVTVARRRQVYCPLPAPTATAGKALLEEPLGDVKSWVTVSASNRYLHLTIDNGALTLKSGRAGWRWEMMAVLQSDNLDNYALSVDVTQSSRTVAGLLIAYRPRSYYLLRLLPNGSWSMNAWREKESVGTGVSFSEPDLKTADVQDPDATVTNTVSLMIQDDAFYLSLNGQFVCGLPLSQIDDPPLEHGQIGVYALADRGPVGKFTVALSNLAVQAIKP
jgi:hypothetical protein